jgi:hypothetical protein
VAHEQVLGGALLQQAGQYVVAHVLRRQQRQAAQGPRGQAADGGVPVRQLGLHQVVDQRQPVLVKPAAAQCERGEK